MKYSFKKMAITLSTFLAFIFSCLGVSSASAFRAVAPVASVNTLGTCGALTFSTPTNFPTATGSGFFDITVSDFNSDGKQDLVIVNLSGDNVSIYLGDGVGGFGGAMKFAVGNGPSSVAVSDFNGDGKEDLATGNYFGTSISILLGDGVGGFSAATNFAVGNGPISVAVSDFNGDGKQDLATVNTFNNDVSILLGDGIGGSLRPQILWWERAHSL